MTAIWICLAVYVLGAWAVYPLMRSEAFGPGPFGPGTLFMTRGERTAAAVVLAVIWPLLFVRRVLCRLMTVQP